MTTRTRYYLFELAGGSFRELTAQEAWEYGGDDTLVEASQGFSLNHWVLECQQYYGRDGICKLEITQSLERALKTFAALLAADLELWKKELRRERS